MITVSIFRSAVDDTKETQRFENPITIKELFSDVDFSNSIISVNGTLQGEHYLLKDGDVCTIRLFPEGNGADWIAGAGLGFMAALAVVNIWNPVGWVAAIAIGVGAAIGALGFGIASAAGWSLTDWLGNLGKVDFKSPSALEGIPQLRGAKNQSNYDKPVPIVLGRHLFTPMYIGSPYTTIAGTDGEEQYFHALYLLGYSRVRVTNISLGPQSLASNDTSVMEGEISFDGYPEYASADPRLELRQGASEVSLYPQAVSEERLSIELLYPKDDKPLDVVRFTAKNPMKVQIEFTLGNGLISYDDENDKKNASVSVSVEWRMVTPNNSDPWKPFGKIGEDQTGIGYAAPVSTITRKKNKVMRFVAEREFSYSEVKNASDRTLELYIKRTNVQANDNKTADKIYLTAIRTWLFDNDASSKRGSMVAQVPMIEKLRNKTARLGFNIKATDNLQGVLDSLNCIVESHCRIWDGTRWTDPDWDPVGQAWIGEAETPSNNPASVALKLLQSPSLGRKAYPDSMLDLDSFGEFYQWCEERKYTCNGVLTAEKRLDDALAIVLSTGRAMRILNGSRYGLLIDKPRDYPVMILNNQNVLEASNTKNFEDLPDGYSIKFINENDGYQQTEVYVMRNGSHTPNHDSVIESIDLPFVTDYDQVVKIGWYLLACKLLRPEIWNRKLSIDGYLIAIGDRVEVQDDTIVVGIGEGAIIKKLKIENNYITEIQTDGIFDVVDTTKSYGIKIMQFDGVNPGKVRTIQVDIPAPGKYSDFTVSLPLNTNPPIPHEGDIVAFGIFDRITTPALCFGKKDNGDGTFDVTLVPYQEGIYTAESGQIPPYEANITTPQGLAPLNEIPPDLLTKDDVINLSKEFAGKPGKNATVYQVIPSISIIRKSAKNVLSPAVISCTQRSITGDGPPVPSNKTIKYITNLSPSEYDYTEPLTVDTRWEYIIFRLYDGDTLLDFEEVPVLSDGIPATIYELLPSVNVVSIYNDGTVNPQTVSCAQYSKTGNDDPLVSDKTLVYTTSADPEEMIPYTGTITVNPVWRWVEFRLYDGAVLLDRENVSILKDGKPATVYTLLSSDNVIRKLSNGEIIPASITCEQQMTTGNNPPVASNKNLVYVTSANSTETPYAGAVAVDPAWRWVEFRLYDGEILLDRERIPVLSDGAPGTSFDLLPSVSIIKKDVAGNVQPGTITCEQQVTAGNELPSSSSKTLKYKTSHSAGELAYTGAITIDPAWQWIEFSLYDGVILLDRERVPVLSDGNDGTDAIRLDILNDSKVITCDVDGVPIDGMLPYYNKATLYRGQHEINARSEYPDDIKKRIYLYPGSGADIFNPLGTGLYPVSTRFVTWSIPNAPAGVTIDNEGNITIEANADLHDSDELIIRAAYNGGIFEIIFTVMKMRLAADGVPGIPGRDGVTYYTWIRYADDAQGNGISNSPTGKEYIGFAYNKVTPVESDLPGDYKWSLIKGADGLDGDTGYTWIRYSDNPDGTLMYQQPRDTTRYIGIAVNKETPVESDNKADYTWSLFKGDDGTSPITVSILNSNKSISCDMFGNPRELPFVTQAFLYKGNDLITDESQYPALYKKQTLRFPGSGVSVFSPGLGVPFPVNRRAVTWSIQGPPGVSIDKCGTITVAGGAALEDENEIMVTGVFEGLPYTTSMNLTKAYAGENGDDGEDGENALQIELRSDSIRIHCDEYGDPHEEVFPIENAAVYHHGASNILSPVAWSLINAPAGVSINSLGVIRIEFGYDYTDTNEITVRGEFKGYVRTKNFSIYKDYDMAAPVTMNLNPDSKTIHYTYSGIPYASNYPCTLKATLYKGTVEITNADWLPRVKRKQIVYYPGSGDTSFSPFGFNVYPASTFAVKWSLINAPAGVGIDVEGTVTVEPWAQLTDTVTITVSAVFDGKTYSKEFTINTIKDGCPGNDGAPGRDGDKGDQGDPSPRYLGKTYELGNRDGTVKIYDNANSQRWVQAHEGDWVAYLGESNWIWDKGVCMRWNGESWEQISVLTDGNFESNPYMAAMFDLINGAPMGAFLSILVQDLIAKTAMIERIFSHKMHVQKIGDDEGALFGGGYDENGNPTGGPGFYLGTNGIFKAVDGTFNNINVTNGTFDAITIIGNSLFQGDIISGPLTLMDETPTSSNTTYPINSTAYNIYIAEVAKLGTSRNVSVKGTYENKDIIRIFFSQDSGSVVIYNIIVTYKNGTTATIAKSTRLLSTGETNHLQRLSGVLSYQYNGGGKTFKLNDIPTSNPGVSGVVWRNGNQLMIS